jgi:capsular exopolysaccharide synthesis family protein
MSNIFDALQRSEGERTGSESHALPQGQELLQQAERQVASDWASGSSGDGPLIEAIAREKLKLASELASQGDDGPSRLLPEKLLSPSERLERLQHFVSVPMSIPPESQLVCLTDRKSPTAEAVRLLAVRLRHIRRNRTLKKVLITSSIPREGKSTIASNLACALARRTDEKVVLIEGDLRLPVFSKLFGIQARPGLCELLHGDAEIDNCICHLPDAGMWIVPAGIAKSNPIELLQSQSMSAVMDQLSALFDWIIIDSPPVLPLADTSIWARIADAALLVTRLGVTEKKLLKKGLEALESPKLLGALLNGSNASRYSSYYYGDTEHSS